MENVRLEEEIRLENLLKELEIERDWRVKEFHIIKRHYLRLENENREDVLKVFTRMTIPVIYAHWEGFCTSAFKLIFKYINEKRPKYNHLTNNLFTYAHEDTYKPLKGKQSFLQKCEFSRKFLDSLTNDPIKLKTKIDTKSNLKYPVLKEMCTILGMDLSKLTTFEADLNKLVNLRNAIAHGENSYSFDFEDITQFTRSTVELIDTLLVELFQFIKEQQYFNDEYRTEGF